LFRRRHRALQNRINQLETHFTIPALSAAMHAGQLPTPAQYDGVRAFLVLSHAEIEQFFEDCVGLVLAKALRRRAAGKRSRVDGFLPIAYRELVAREFGSPKPAVRVALDEHDRFVARKNHGIALSNLAQMFGPLGLECSIIDPAYVAALETLRAKRGECAHSSAVSVTVQPNPDDAQRAVQDVSAGFHQYLEQHLLRLCP
jgi:hypothetical protein